MDSESNHENTFIGRDYDFVVLNEKWSSCRIFGIFGLRAVGKSRFVKEFIRRKDIEVLHVHLNTVNDVGYFYSFLCASLGTEPKVQAASSVRWIKHILEELKRKTTEKQLVVFFDNAEDTIESSFKDSLLSLIVAIAKYCPKVKTMVTSTRRIQFSQLSKIYCLHEMKPLRHMESKCMLQTVAPDIDLGTFGDVIIELSEGLPLLILMIGAELKINFVSPEEMVDLLLLSRLETLSKDNYPAEDRVADVYKNFIKRLSDVYQQYLASLNFIPGSFNAEEACELLDFESVAIAKQQGLKPILTRYVINYDSTSQRFNIQGILREVISTSFVIKNLPGIRAKYCKVFTKVMKEIAKKMPTDEYTRAMSTFVDEQPNLRKLLWEVNNRSQETSTYPFFIEMASSCTELIEVFMPSESEQFYNGCLRLADKYGQDVDKAAVLVAVGNMETYTKGDLQTGIKKYTSALKIIENKGQRMQLATLYQKMGWNVFKQGDCTEAIRLYKKSLEISSTAGKVFEALTLQSLSNLGVVHVVLGNFKLGEKYHSICLQRSEALQGKNHPNVGIALNRIGLLHDQRGDPKTGLEFFKQGLEVKRASKAAPITIVYSLSNVANGHKDMGMFKEAHEFVDEAFAILQDQKMSMLDGFSLMYNTRGKIYAKEGKLKEAAEAYGKTVEITRQVEQTSYIFMKRLVNLAEVLEGRRKFASALKLANEALALKDEVIKSLPHNFIVTECLQCMSRIYDVTRNHDKYVETLYEIDEECVRLLKVCSQLNNQQKLDHINETIKDLQLKFRNLKTLN